MTDSEENRFSHEAKVRALLDVARYDPKLSLGIVGLGIFAALLEGVGVSFILPIVELVQADGDPTADAEGLLAWFVFVYQTMGVPFTLGFVIAGVLAVMTVRYVTSFAVAWLREYLRTYYVRDLQDRAFGNTLDARVEYFDEEGSDDILNAIVTQTYYAGRVIQRGIKLLEQVFISAMYFLVAVIVSPLLTFVTVVILGGFTILFRHFLESGYDLGDDIADANEQRQEAVQAGTQGIRDIRIFGLAEELYNDFTDAIDKYTRTRIRVRRNEAAIENFYNLVVAGSVFVLVYVALTFADLSLGALGVFLFAMFRLAPRVSTLNKHLYNLENDLPHLVRTSEFINELERYEEPNETSIEVPDEIEHVEFDGVWFSYDDSDPILRGLDFEVKKGEFVAFVGRSGAGKSTIVSLLTQMYRPDRGEIRANGASIGEMDVEAWRSRLAVVRQNPFIFNDTLKYNLTIGNRDASSGEIQRVCEIAMVDEFLEELPNGYGTMLGDEGVRLSGGQKQRVALARALLKEADLLILDEATSDLDSNLEQKVQMAIESMDRDYGIVVIAHRLSTVSNADRIYTVDDGRIIETGTHRELLDDDGQYAKLYTIQSES